jgi:hypothetical protein
MRLCCITLILLINSMIAAAFMQAMRPTALPSRCALSHAQRSFSRRCSTSMSSKALIEVDASPYLKFLEEKVHKEISQKKTCTLFLCVAKIQPPSSN